MVRKHCTICHKDKAVNPSCSCSGKQAVFSRDDTDVADRSSMNTVRVVSKLKPKASCPLHTCQCDKTDPGVKLDALDAGNVCQGRECAVNIPQDSNFVDDCDFNGFGNDYPRFTNSYIVFTPCQLIALKQLVILSIVLILIGVATAMAVIYMDNDDNGQESITHATTYRTHRPVKRTTTRRATTSRIVNISTEATTHLPSLSIVHTSPSPTFLASSLGSSTDTSTVRKYAVGSTMLSSSIMSSSLASSPTSSTSSTVLNDSSLTSNDSCVVEEDVVDAMALTVCQQGLLDVLEAVQQQASSSEICKVFNKLTRCVRRKLKSEIKPSCFGLGKKIPIRELTLVVVSTSTPAVHDDLVPCVHTAV